MSTLCRFIPFHAFTTHATHTPLDPMTTLLGADYDSSDGENASAPGKNAPPKHIDAAPDVAVEVWSPYPINDGRSDLTSYRTRHSSN